MVKATDYLYRPIDITSDLRSLYYRLKLRDIFGVLLLIGLGLLFHSVLRWRIETIFFSLFSLTILYWWLDGRIPLGLGLASLIAIPLILFIFRRNLFAEYWSERIAVWAYYFLSIGVLKLLLDHVRERRTPRGMSFSPRFGMELYQPLRTRHIDQPKKYMDLHKKES